MFKTSWNRCWSNLCSGQSHDGETLMSQLLSAYNEPQRAYHTQQHLAECLHLFNEYSQYAVQPEAVEIAIWFHDAIYDLHAPDNEEQSAKWAIQALLDNGIDQKKAQRVHDLIMATQHHASPDDPDKQLLVDIDLAILGAEPERFHEYEQQIRQEYSFVPEATFTVKRQEVLQAFYDRPKIYSTPVLQKRFERQAKANLAQALTSLNKSVPSR